LIKPFNISIYDRGYDTRRTFNRIRRNIVDSVLFSMRVTDADAGGANRAIPGGSVVWIDPILGDVGVAGATPSPLATSIRLDPPQHCFS
jgi:hypothetical protein